MFKKIIAFALILVAIYWSFSALLPSKISQLDANNNTFSTQRALVHLKEISKTPHYVGSETHDDVMRYIVQELQKLGLQTQIQEGYSYNKKWGSLTQVKNILARVKGSDNTKALLLLSHYDSSPHSSFGASDAGSGVVTILEGVRAFLNTNKTPKNDLIILLTDAEELGLNGADVFVNQHEWAKDVGLVLNFEARGSGGPSYMLAETNGGNSKMIDGFKAANPEFPVTNSLAYSVYKKLPNDTDLTYFREDGNIQGFNFAFIDDHFDYHTALDNYERLDRETLEHQGSYLMPLLAYFSQADLTTLTSQTDDVYFNVPLFKTISYPNTWIFPMLLFAIILFIALVLYGIKKHTLSYKQIGIGMLPGIAALAINGIIGFFGWKTLTALYPNYNEILHGFTYNGHTYILAFALLSAGICMWLYNKVYKPENTASLTAGPIVLWLIICTLIALYLEGASFFIIPVYFALISLFILVRQKKPNLIVLALLLFPALTILSPFVKMFPVGLGLKTIIAATLLVALIFSLCMSLLGFFRRKHLIAYALLIGALVSFMVAHFNSTFNTEHPKPNSLVYMLDADNNTAAWATYDHILDDWTKAYLTENPTEILQDEKIVTASKYKTEMTFSKSTTVKPIEQPTIKILKDTVIGELKHVRLLITPNRKVNRIEVFADTTNTFNSFKANTVQITKDIDEQFVFENRKQDRLLIYYLTKDNFLDLEFTVPKTQKTTFKILEASFNLLTDPMFNVPERPETTIPKPFIINDAVVIKKTITVPSNN
ncbi:M28 family peptidase [Lacinutrix undariae]